MDTRPNKTRTRRASAATASGMSRTTRRRRKPRQGTLTFRSWGGPRRGSGRKPVGEKSGVSHRTRLPLASRFPVHVTVRLQKGLPRLRRKAEYEALREAFRKGSERFGFRLVHYSVQNDHIHLIGEAKDRRALSRGMQGLKVRIARALNRLWGRVGSVFADRYHDVVLKTPRQVRNALAYVLNNARRHGAPLGQLLDLFTSGVWFDGYREKFTVSNLDGVERPVADARTWLLGAGWRRHGLVGVQEVPGPPLRVAGRRRP